MKALVVIAAACTHPAPLARPNAPATPAATPAEGSPPQPAALPPPPATGDRVLLAVTGYSAERDDITSADLARDVCGGQLAVVEAARARAEVAFHCTPGKTIADLHDALADAKTHVVITDLDHVTNQWKALRVDGVAFFSKPRDYPLVVGENGARPDFAPHLTHFIMTGVTAIARHTGEACVQHGVEWLTENLRSEFTGADYVHISNEVSIKPDCTYPSGPYTFCTKEHDFQALLDLHANVIELTGNHNRDFGDEPFKKTMDWYKAHDMATFGGGLTPELANEPVILPLADGKKLGIIGFNEACPLKECAKRRDEVGANAYDAAKARAAIARMRDELGADFIIVTVQFREWDNAEPTPSQHKISHALVDAGADLVYGSQAHQLQLVEFYKGAPIFHGLGNLLFDQIHRVGVRQGFFLHHYFWNGKLVQSVPVFTFMADSRQPTLATPEQAAEMKAVIFRDDLLYR